MKTGVLLVNLGTPSSPSTGDVRKYLTQFLNDPRVIDISPIGRFFLVNFIIVPFRASKSAKLYQQVWTKEGSPLLIHGNKVKEKLRDRLDSDFEVELGMRYQDPSIESALEKLRKQRVEKIIIIPLYPQYASSSTGSSVEKAMDILRKWEVTPTVKIINKFYDRPAFINAIAEVAKKYDLAAYDHYLFSYHGLPERHIRKSDAHYGAGECVMGDCCNSISSKNQYCYRASCFETTRQLVKKLNLPEGKCTTSFQSRLDDKWIKPYSDKVLAELARKGVKKVLCFSPAFVADCLETIHEIGTEYDELFREHGGEKVQLVESLNDSSAWIDALREMVLENC
ncbi:MAG TPA: ferrochelatase [Bacteroidia bacterium]|jgi:ferrochelatase